MQSRLSILIPMLGTDGMVEINVSPFECTGPATPWPAETPVLSSCHVFTAQSNDQREERYVRVSAQR